MNVEHKYQFKYIAIRTIWKTFRRVLLLPYYSLLGTVLTQVLKEEASKEKKSDDKKEEDEEKGDKDEKEKEETTIQQHVQLPPKPQELSEFS